MGEAVCGGAICEMEPGLALALTPQPYRDWWKGSCSVAQCEFPKEDPSYQLLGSGSCRSADVRRYTNHYFKYTSHSECVEQCNADQRCTHIEWGPNGGGGLCVIFYPQQFQGLTPAGWTFKPGNGGMAITQADGSDRVKCWANVKPNPADYQVLGTGSCRSANVWTYPNHYLKTDSTSALTRSACVKQCNADEGCTHMEWGFNGNGERQCVIFSPGSVPIGWAFVPGNGGGGANASSNRNRWPGCARTRRTGTCTQRKPIRGSATRTTPGRTISPATGGMRPSAAVLSVRWSLVWL